MRRVRDVKEHGNALRRKKIAEQRKKRAKLIIRNKKPKTTTNDIPHSVVQIPNTELKFVDFNSYVPDRKINVCHVIESLGMGGGQTMMMELIRGLNQYYPNNISNFVVCPRTSNQKYESSLYSSYGITPIVMREREFPRFLSSNNINIALQHRLAISKCIKPLLTSSARYILMNHTYHQLARLPGFTKCHYYVNVCKYLDKESRFYPPNRVVILNGVDSDYIADIVPADLSGEIKSGRCHRLVGSKFKLDSLDWLETISAKHLPGHHHYLIGHSGEAKKLCKSLPHCHYLGAISDRTKKMSILKALDFYFYETFQQEGASVAILESLACGVPVLCKDYGGNSELIRNGVNGFIVKDRDDFLRRMMEFAANPEKLKELKKSTYEDFYNRLHIKHVVCKYMQLFQKVMSL